ncbi:DUF2779 domain-containing protein [Candidatus Izemoplasma sp. B36]|uniref:DUF2779 domain-containing protein n=1 Tax=Candidatus Izemoplasma sp. B36 TaxID=3242468 RepID=UPI003557F5C9
MKVTANVLLNYIRCRRFASLNDPDSDIRNQEFEVHSKNYFQEYLNIFKHIFEKEFTFKEINKELTYDFHNDIVLSEDYHFVVDNQGIEEIYILVPQTSRNLTKLKYKSQKHRYQMFNKDKLGFLCLNKKNIIDTSNYNKKINKLKDRHDDLGRVIYKYAFKRYIYDLVNPKKNTKIYFVLLNSDYIHDGKKYTKQLFSIFDFSGLYIYFDDVIEADIYRMINHIELDDFTPCDLIKKECNKDDSFECKFVDFCFSHLPKNNSILNYFHAHTGFAEPDKEGDIHHDVYDLINEGKVSMEDIPISWIKDEKHLMQRYCSESNYIHIHKEKIKAALKTLKFPLIYLDFEALPCLLPRYKGERPYSQSVFQYSIHIQFKDSTLKLDDKNHYEFLANPEFDNRKELVKSMISLVNKYDSSIIVFHKTFEEQRLRELQEIFPEYRDDLQNILDRIFDLLDIVRNNKKLYKKLGFNDADTNRYNFYSRELNGSYSLKKVIKVFNREAYENLEIKDGVDAYKAYLTLTNLDQIERDKTMKNLLEYCKQDTYSMYEIIEGLKKYL